MIWSSLCFVCSQSPSAINSIYATYYKRVQYLVLYQRLETFGLWLRGVIWKVNLLFKLCEAFRYSFLFLFGCAQAKCQLFGGYYDLHVRAPAVDYMFYHVSVCVTEGVFLCNMLLHIMCRYPKALVNQTSVFRSLAWIPPTNWTFRNFSLFEHVSLVFTPRFLIKF